MRLTYFWMYTFMFQKYRKIVYAYLSSIILIAKVRALTVEFYIYMDSNLSFMVVLRKCVLEFTISLTLIYCRLILFYGVRSIMPIFTHFQSGTSDYDFTFSDSTGSESMVANKAMYHRWDVLRSSKLLKVSTMI